MRPITALTLLLFTSACDPVYESESGGGSCDAGAGAGCTKVLVVPLPEGVREGELVLNGKIISTFSCPEDVTCDVSELVWLSDWGKPRDLTLRAGGRAWRVNVGPAVIERPCTRDCVKRYSSTLELID
jgi:hypothetical protein